MADLLQFPQLSIQPAQPEDLPELVAVYRDIWLEIYGATLPTAHLEAKDAAAFQADIQPFLSNLWLARLGRRLVGFSAVQMNVLEHLWVVPEQRRRGIGGRLLDAALAAMRAGDYAHAQVGLDGCATAALAFFQAKAWHCLHQEWHKLDQGSLHIAVYSRPLTPAQT